MPEVIKKNDEKTENNVPLFIFLFIFTVAVIVVFLWFFDVIKFSSSTNASNATTSNTSTSSSTSTDTTSSTNASTSSSTSSTNASTSSSPTDNGFTAKNITSENDLIVKGNITSGKISIASGAQFCIGNTCIDESQLKQLVRRDIQNTGTPYKPSDYYKLVFASGNNDGSRLYYNTVQTNTGYRDVETYISGNSSVRIKQIATNTLFNTQTDSQLKNNIQTIYGRYSLGNKSDIETDSKKDAWSDWFEIGENFAKKSQFKRIIKSGATSSTAYDGTILSSLACGTGTKTVTSTDNCDWANYELADI